MSWKCSLKSFFNCFAKRKRELLITWTRPVIQLMVSNDSPFTCKVVGSSATVGFKTENVRIHQVERKPTSTIESLPLQVPSKKAHGLALVSITVFITRRSLGVSSDKQICNKDQICELCENGGKIYHQTQWSFWESRFLK